LEISRDYTSTGDWKVDPNPLIWRQNK
jgi:hypothetical protein